MPIAADVGSSHDARLSDAAICASSVLQKDLLC